MSHEIPRNVDAVHETQQPRTTYGSSLSSAEFQSSASPVRDGSLHISGRSMNFDAVSGDRLFDRVPELSGAFGEARPRSQVERMVDFAVTRHRTRSQGGEFANALTTMDRELEPVYNAMRSFLDVHASGCYGGGHRRGGGGSGRGGGTDIGGGIDQTPIVPPGTGERPGIDQGIDTPTAPGQAGGEQDNPSDNPADAVVRILTPTGEGTAAGTGFFVSSDGTIMTDMHVVNGAQGPVTIVLPDGRVVQAQIAATDQAHDLALLKVVGGQPGQFETLDIAAGARAGGALSLGHPGGIPELIQKNGDYLGDQRLSNFALQGNISDVNRDISVFGIPVEGGDSGGPTLQDVDRDGDLDVVGITQFGGGGISLAAPGRDMLAFLDWAERNGVV